MALTNFLNTGRSPMHIMALSPAATGGIIHSSVRFDYLAGSERPLYVGHSISGNEATTDWYVCKFEYDADERLTSMKYAKFISWTDRGTAAYV